MFATRAEAKSVGWFSRRHKTNVAHIQARNARMERESAKMARAMIQNEATKLRKEKEAAKSERF